MKVNDPMTQDLMRRYGEELNEEEVDLIKESFWSSLRSDLYKKIIRDIDGAYQWAYITGKKNYYSNGKRIYLSAQSIKYLSQVVTYLNSEEGVQELMDLGISNPPEHIDELMSILAFSKTDRELKRDQFRLFLKHKHKIMRFLLR